MKSKATADRGGGMQSGSCILQVVWISLINPVVSMRVVLLSFRTQHNYDFVGLDY